MKESDLSDLAELTAEELIARGERMLALGRELQGLAAQVGESQVELKPHEERKLHQIKPDERCVNRRGEIITVGVALSRALLLQEFDRAEFSEALALTPPQTIRWISELMSAGEIERTDDGFQATRKPPLKLWIAARNGDGPFVLPEAAQATGISPDELESELGRLEQEGVVKFEAGQWDYLPPPGGALEHLTETPPEKYPPSYTEVTPGRGAPVRIRTERKQRRSRSTPGQRQKAVNNERNWERLQAAKEQREREGRERQARRASGGKRGRRK